jgi:hypothetical protein
MVKDDSAEKTAAELIAMADDRLALVSWHDWIRLIRVAALREFREKNERERERERVRIQAPLILLIARHRTSTTLQQRLGKGS